MGHGIFRSGCRPGLVSVIRRRLSWFGWPAGCRICPCLRSRFAAGELSLDQVDSISKLATAETEEAVIAECLGLSNAALDRAARRANPPTTEDAVDSWRVRWLSIQYTLDGIRGHLNADLPGPEMAWWNLRSGRERIGSHPTLNQASSTRIRSGWPTDWSNCVPPPVMRTVRLRLRSLSTPISNPLIENSETGVAEIEGGPVIANETARRLSCDPIVECAVYDHRKVLGIGRRSRLIPAWLRHQLWHRDGGCQWPGCRVQRLAPRPPQDPLG